MNRKTRLTFIFGLQMLFASHALAQLRDGPLVSLVRCEEWGDSLTSGQETTVRMNYASRCARGNQALLDLIERVRAYGVIQARGAPVYPGYPTYGLIKKSPSPGEFPYENPENWFAPKNDFRNDEPCLSMPLGYEIIGFCAAGCYTPTQSLLLDPIEGSSMTALDIYRNKINMLATVSEKSQIGSIHLTSTRIDQWVTDIKPGRHPILKFRTSTGGSLEITPNHPLLSAAGEIRRADEFKTGDFLVKADGSLDMITEIKSKEHVGYVYNFMSESDSPTDHLYVAQGFINGSMAYQNEEIMLANRELLRLSLTENLIKNSEQE